LSGRPTLSSRNLTKESAAGFSSGTANGPTVNRPTVNRPGKQTKAAKWLRIKRALATAAGSPRLLAAACQKASQQSGRAAPKRPGSAKKQFPQRKKIGLPCGSPVSLFPIKRGRNLLLLLSGLLDSLLSSLLLGSSCLLSGFLLGHSTSSVKISGKPTPGSTEVPARRLTNLKQRKQIIFPREEDSVPNGWYPLDFRCACSRQTIPRNGFRSCDHLLQLHTQMSRECQCCKR
jgi:hypothetical protein